MRILVIEDDPDLRRIVGNVLLFNGFMVDAAEDGAEALGLHAAKPADLIILDLMMPRMDGFKVLQQLRQRADHVPVIMLTARGEEEDRVKGLAMGADDYLVKPFSMLELIERIKAILRRTKFTQPPQVMHSGTIRLDVVGMSVSIAGQDVPLSAKEFRILHLLMSRSGTTLGRSDLLKLAWEEDARPTARTVDSHLARLRKKLGDSENQGWIRTIGGEGYRWTLPVTVERE